MVAFLAVHRLILHPLLRPVSVQTSVRATTVIIQRAFFPDRKGPHSAVDAPC